MSERSAGASVPERPRLGRAVPGAGPTIAITAPSYNLERVSYLLPSTRHRYVRLRRVPLQRLERHRTFLDQVPLILGRPVDLVHTFNQLPLGRRFVVTSEMELPRFLGDPPAWQRRFGVHLLASDLCRGIWPLSEAGAAYVRRRVAPAIARKITVFRGGLPMPDPTPRDYSTAGPIRLLFVGGDGLRKGLEPTLRAAERLRADGVEVEVTVVGQPTAESYPVPGMHVPVEPVRAMLTGHAWITHHVSLPNVAVRRLMREHDVFVLPTMDESLGWVVCEAALEGTASLTTDIFALPELVVDGETGWTIGLPLDEDRRWAHIGRADAAEAWHAAQARIVDGITRIVAGIAADRGLVERYGVAARRHIGALYDMDAAAARLDALYAAAIAGR